MGQEFPGEHTPAGKPSITKRGAAVSKGTVPIHTGHGVGYGQTCAERTFNSKTIATGGQVSKGTTSVHTGHGTGYGSETSRG